MSTPVFKNKNILITAGPTKESIDIDSHISTISSGKLGYALANYLVHQGARVILISGPVCIELEHPNLIIEQVQSALEMDAACCKYYEQTDIAIFSANASKYRAEKVEVLKNIRQDGSFQLKMIPNIDIAFEFGKVKKPHQIAIGFANNPYNNFNKVVAKMERKNFDMVVLEQERIESSCEKNDIGKLEILHKNHSKVEKSVMTYTTAAKNIVGEIEFLISNNERHLINTQEADLKNKCA